MKRSRCAACLKGNHDDCWNSHDFPPGYTCICPCNEVVEREEEY